MIQNDSNRLENVQEDLEDQTPSVLYTQRESNENTQNPVDKTTDQEYSKVTGTMVESSKVSNSNYTNLNSGTDGRTSKIVSDNTNSKIENNTPHTNSKFTDTK